VTQPTLEINFSKNVFIHFVTFCSLQINIQLCPFFHFFIRKYSLECSLAAHAGLFLISAALAHNGAKQIMKYYLILLTSKNYEFSFWLLFVIFNNFWYFSI
jgi:hypothetical protein